MGSCFKIAIFYFFATLASTDWTFAGEDSKDAGSCLKAIDDLLKPYRGEYGKYQFEANLAAHVLGHSDFSKALDSFQKDTEYPPFRSDTFDRNAVEDVRAEIKRLESQGWTTEMIEDLLLGKYLQSPVNFFLESLVSGNEKIYDFFFKEIKINFSRWDRQLVLKVLNAAIVRGLVFLVEKIVSERDDIKLSSKHLRKAIDLSQFKVANFIWDQGVRPRDIASLVVEILEQHSPMYVIEERLDDEAILVLDRLIARDRKALSDSRLLLNAASFRLKRFEFILMKGFNPNQLVSNDLSSYLLEGAVYKNDLARIGLLRKYGAKFFLKDSSGKIINFGMPCHIAGYILDAWNDDLKKGIEPNREEILSLRDQLLNIFLNRDFSYFSSMLGFGPAEALHHLQRMSVMKFSKPVINDQIINMANIYRAARLRSSGSPILPGILGHMAIGILGVYNPVSRERPAHLAEIELTLNSNTPDTVIQGVEFVQLELKSNQAFRMEHNFEGTLNVWKLKRSKVVMTVPSSGGALQFESFGLLLGGSVAIYREINSGLMIYVCLNNHLIMTERLNWAVDEFHTRSQTATDPVQTLEDFLPSISVEFREGLISKILEDSRYEKYFRDQDKQRIRRLVERPLWSDVSAQVEIIRDQIARYYQLVPQEAEEDFKLRDKGKMGFEIISDRGEKLVMEWLKKSGMEFPHGSNAKDALAYVHSLMSINSMEGWFRLPYEQAMLLIFRDEKFDHPIPEKSHLWALKEISKLIGPIFRNEMEAISLEDARSAYTEALKTILTE